MDYQMAKTVVLNSLRAVSCPSEIIDQIGGWSSGTVGASYGKGYELPVLFKWMKMMEE